MLFKMTELKYRPDPVLEHALDVLFILHADHEQNCSTTAARVVGSSLADPYSVVAAAAAALSGPRHGGANEEVVRMLHEIGSVANVPALIKAVKAGERRLMGFGHRVYKNYDPRAKIIKEVAHQVFEVTGKSPLIDIARRAREDRPRRRVLREAPAVSRTSISIRASSTRPWASRWRCSPCSSPSRGRPGWMAQWAELVLDEEQKISRPKQLYMGHEERPYAPLDMRRDIETQEETEVHGPI